MSLLPAEPRQRKQALLLMGAIVMAGWYASKIYFADPHQDVIQVRAAHLEELTSQNRRSKALAARRDDLRRRMEMYERQLRIFEEFIPQSQEVPELLDAISREAQLTGVELASIRPQNATPGEFYTQQTWQLSVVGDYHNVGRYMSRIASLPRIIKPTGVQISRAPQSRATRNMVAPLEVSFAIETYILERKEEGAEGTQGASSGG